MSFYAQFSSGELRNILRSARREAAHAHPRRRELIYRLEVDPILQEFEVRGLQP